MTMAALDPRREQMLAEMGIKPRWRLREGDAAQADAPAAAVEDSPVQAAVAPLSVAPAAPAPEASPRPTAVAVPADVGMADEGWGDEPIATGSDEPPAWLNEVDAVDETSAVPPPQAMRGRAPGAAAAAAPAPASSVDARGLDWDGLVTATAACRACRLCERRKQAVLGVGDREADWMIVGEGPGAEEDERGEPFVGQAGRLLDAMLPSIGLTREQNVYIANAVKCRPPGNRTPQPDEMAACRPYLVRQIELVRPKLILAMGRPAVQTLLGGEPRISASRGKVFHYENIPVVVTYHPAYLLRNLPDKAKAWEDLCFAVDVMAGL
jgi:uracil-DNA glycosylase